MCQKKRTGGKKMFRQDHTCSVWLRQRCVVWRLWLNSVEDRTNTRKKTLLTHSCLNTPASLLGVLHYA